MPGYGLTLQSFAPWAATQTEEWWTANNKVKHHRHTHFSSASLENMLDAMSALFVSYIYLHEELTLVDQFTVGASLCYANRLEESISPTAFGMVPNYKMV
jgi:hypothetical protein